MRRFLMAILLIVLAGCAASISDTNKAQTFNVKIEWKWEGLTAAQVAEVESAMQQVVKYNADGKKVKSEYKIVEMKAR